MAAVCAWIGFRYLAGEIIAGRRVRRVTDWQGLSEVLPIPYPLAVYYVYTDESGTQVKHGPYKSFDRRGNLAYDEFYQDGKLDGTRTTFGSTGQKKQETFWRMGQEIGQANYKNGQLDYEVKYVFENGVRVGMKKFEGHWSLEFFCGNKIDKGINPQTGEVFELTGPVTTACQ